MAQEFKPSNKSHSPEAEVLARLNYLKRAAEVLEGHVGKSGMFPAWVVDRINQAVVEAGMAVSYVQMAEKRFQESKSDTVKTESVKPKRSK